MEKVWWKKPNVESVHVWLSPNCDTEYSISFCDKNGEEIECIGGGNDVEAAWLVACDEAESLGVPALLSPYESGEVTRTWNDVE